MFDFSFGKLAIIFILCLIVLGPEKLPKLAQTLGRFAGQARAMARHFRDQLETEIAASELAKQKRELEAAVQKSVETIRDPVAAVSNSVTDAARDIAAPIIDPMVDPIEALDPGSANNSGHGDYDPLHEQADAIAAANEAPALSESQKSPS